VTIAVAVSQTLLETLFAALAAYSLVFLHWRGRALVFALIVATLAVPNESLVIPNYELVSDLGLRNSITGIVLPYAAAGYPVFLLRQAFRQVSREVWEAARLDGCSHLRMLFQVVVPICRGFVIACAMWAALQAWNGYFWPLLITDSPDKRPIQVGLAQLVSAEQTSPTVLFAGLLLVSAPTLVLVVFGQRLLVRGASIQR
jgi:ABC-type glycerol-3-phosphate transport system permease component